MNNQEIIELFWQRSERAITETAARFGVYCRSIAWNLLGNREDVGECLNDTWPAAWNQIPPDRPRNLAIYLGRITRNIALDRYDYYHAKKRDCQMSQLLSELQECTAAVDSAEQVYVAGEASRLISQFLREQELERRTIFIRRYWYGDSIRTIAKNTKTSESYVKSLLFRMRKSLREYLEQEGVSI